MMNVTLRAMTGEDSGSPALTFDKPKIMVTHAHVIACAFTLMALLYAAVLYVVCL